MDQQTAENKLHNAYQQILGHDIDEANLRAHTDRLVQNQETVRDVVRNLAHSPEFKQRFLDTHPSPPDQITLAYKQFLGRDPDSQGLETYKQEMAAGKPIDDVINDLIGSQEYTNKFGDEGVPHP
jgi:phycobilisome core-membrane linker protein